MATLFAPRSLSSWTRYFHDDNIAASNVRLEVLNELDLAGGIGPVIAGDVHQVDVELEV